MRFGKPRPSGPSQHPTGLPNAPGIIPANAGTGGHIQKTLDALASASARKQEEAISNIDSVDLFVWQRLTSGTLCSCQGGAPPEDTNSDPNVISVDDTPSEPSVNDGFGTIKVRAYDVSPTYRHENWSNPFVSSAEPAHHFGATSDSDVVQDTFVDTDALLHGDPNDGLTLGGPGQNPADHEYDHTNGLFDDELMADYETEMADGWSPDALLSNAYLLGVTHTACPLCYNVGYVGGYELWGGTHRVLPVEYSDASDKAFLLEDAASVPVWEVEPGGYVSWSIKIPSYFTVAWNLARNNRQPAIGFAFEFSIIGQDGQPRLDLLASSPLDDLKVKVINVSAETQKLTHVDLTVRHVPLRGQVTNITKQAGLDQQVKADAITVTLPAKVGYLDANSIITETKYNLVWRTTAIETISDHNRRVTSVSAQTKLVGPSEVESLLNPWYEIRLADRNLYGGVEPIQGVR